MAAMLLITAAWPVRAKAADTDSNPNPSYEEGYESGYQAGWRDGYHDGEEAGYEAGYEDGYNAGVDSTIDFFVQYYELDSGIEESLRADSYWRRTVEEEGVNIDSDYLEFYW